MVHFFQLNKEEALKALPHKAKEVSLEEAYEVLFRIHAKSFLIFFAPCNCTAPARADNPKKTANPRCVGACTGKLRIKNIHYIVYCKKERNQENAWNFWDSLYNLKFHNLYHNITVQRLSKR